MEEVHSMHTSLSLFSSPCFASAMREGFGLFRFGSFCSFSFSYHIVLWDMGTFFAASFFFPLLSSDREMEEMYVCG